MPLSYEQEVYHSYQILEAIEENAVPDYEIRILQENHLHAFLPFQIRTKNGGSRYYYELPTRETLADQLTRGFGMPQLTGFTGGLVDALDEAAEYLLDENALYLQPAAICQDEEGNYRFTYYPGYRRDILFQLQDLAALFLKAVNYKDQEAVAGVYEFYHRVCGEQGSLKALREYVFLGLRERTAVRERPPVMLFTQEDGGDACVPLSAQMLSAKAGGEEEIDVREQPQAEGWPVCKTTQRDHETVEKIAYKNKTNRKRESVPVKRRRLLLLCPAEVIAGAVCTWLLYDFFGLYTMLPFILLTGLTAAVGLSGLSKEKEAKQMNKESEDVGGQMMNGDTTVLDSVVSGEVVLHSCRQPGEGDLYLTRFPAVLGKEASVAEYRIAVPTVSRRHAQIDIRDGEVFLTDLNSTNHSRINSRILEPMQPYRLQEGDRVMFAEEEYRVELSAWGKTAASLKPGRL